MRALVLAGGGMRGAYTAGVVEALAEMGERFDAVYGTSSGGATAAWFAAGQLEDFRDSWRYAKDPEIMNFTRWVTRRGPLLDLDRLIYHVYPNELGFDEVRVRKTNFPVVITTSHVETARTHFFDLRKIPVLRGLRATSALPLASEGTVEVEGEHYLDGGLTTPLPLCKAIKDGHREIVVVLNKPGEERRAEPLPFSWYFGRQFPALACAGRNHHLIINDGIQLARSPPEGVEVTLVRPQRDHGLTRFTRDLGRIQLAIEQGREEARAVFA